MVKPVNKTLRIAAMSAGEEIGHASGPVVTFRGNGDPLCSLLANIEPVQDLHGYENPWPAGGGKNKFDVGTSANDYTNSARINAITNNITGNSIAFNVASSGGTFAFRSQDITTFGQFIVSGTASKKYSRVFVALRKADNSGWADSSDYTISGFTYNQYYAGWYSDNPYTDISKLVNIPECPYWRIGFGYGNNEAQGGTVETISNIQLELGSTATPWTPYSNLCPLSGWSAANLWRTGKNLFDFVDYSTWSNGYLTANGTPSGTPAVAPAYERCSPYIPIKGGQAYTLSYAYNGSLPSGGAASNNVCFYDAAKVLVGARASSASATAITATAPSSAVYMRFSVRTYDIAENYQIELSSTATTYEPYSGNQYTLQLGQTVYGGTLDVTNGVLTVTHGIVDMGALTWNKGTTQSTSYGEYTHFTAAPTPAKAPNFNFISSCYKTAQTHRNALNNGEMGVSNTNSSGYKSFAVRNDAYADSTGTEFATAMSGQTIVYELATPITIPLTATQISTLQGENNVWADSGDVDVEYIATGGEGGKLALLLRNRKELLIALRKGLTPAEAGLLNSTPLLGGFVRPGLSTDDEKEEDDLW